METAKNKLTCSSQNVQVCQFSEWNHLEGDPKQKIKTQSMRNLNECFLSPRSN